MVVESSAVGNDENENRPRASSFGQILHCSQAPALKKGIAVTILRTENEIQRCPHLVGQEGVVKEAPGKCKTLYIYKFIYESIHL